MDLRRALTLAAGLLVIALSAAAGARAEASVGPGAAQRAADRDPEVRAAVREHGALEPTVVREDARWRVSYRDESGEEVARALVAIEDGSVRESWRGYQAAWQMARGREGQFGHALNAPYVWLPMCAIFLLGLLDWRRPLRLVHLDLLVLLSFGVSHIYFNHGEIGVSAPLAYPPLIYLLARMVWLGLRGAEPLRPTLRAGWLALAVVFLLAFRITLNIADSGVIDVGYAGVIGADRILSGEPIYAAFPDDNPAGDTYGPAAYLAYVPFVLAFGWSGEWDSLPAAHAAAIGFDLAAILGLLALGRRLRPGRRGLELGVVLAFAWTAFPYTAFALQSNSNDSLLAALVIWSLVLFSRPLLRGVLLALAAATKFAPLALVPLYAGGFGRPSARAVAAFSAGLAAAALIVLVQPALDPGIGAFWERTIANQAERSSPFSIWGQTELDWLRLAAAAATAAAALGLALWPRRRSLPQVAGLTAAALIAVQLVTEHWFYLYIPWFLGPLLAALAAGGRIDRTAPRAEIRP